LITKATPFSGAASSLLSSLAAAGILAGVLTSYVHSLKQFAKSHKNADVAVFEKESLLQ